MVEKYEFKVLAYRFHGKNWQQPSQFEKHFEWKVSMRKFNIHLIKPSALQKYISTK